MANGARLRGSENEMKKREKRDKKTFRIFIHFNPFDGSCSIMSKQNENN